MAGLLLQVGSMDLTEYVRAQPDEGLDPTGSGAHITQLFGGSTALADGQVSVGEAVGNRLFAAPLWLNVPGSADGVLSLLSQLKAACVKGAVVQFRAEGTSQISYLDLQSKDIKEHFSHYHVRAGWLKCDVTLYCSPRATTGTTRLVASQFGTGPLLTFATSLAGDADALANLRILQNDPMSGPIFSIYGIRQAATTSFQPVRSFLSMSHVPSPPITTLGGSGAIGSQFVAVDLASGANAVLVDQFVGTVMPAYVGRHRVLLVARSNITPASAVTFTLSHDTTFGEELATLAVVRASQVSNTKWSVYDMGEFPFLASRTQYIKLAVANAGGSRISGASSVQLNALVLVPLDSVGIDTFGTNGIGYGGTRFVRFESEPEVRVVRYNGDDIETRDAVGRGGPPRLPAMASGAAPAAIVSMRGCVDDYVGNARITTSIEVRERFTFLR